jgi:hypothetical protein
MTAHNKKIYKNLVMHSVSNDPDKAKAEWSLKTVIDGSNMCMVCGHRIKIEVWLVNKNNGNTLCVGSICAEELLSVRETYVMLDAIEMAKKKAKRKRDAIKNAKEMDAMRIKSGHEQLRGGALIRLTNVEWVEHLISLGKL